MLKIVTVASALALAVPAMAGDLAEAEAGMEGAGQSVEAATEDGTPMDGTAEVEAGMADETAQSGAVNDPAQVDAYVDAQFSQFDADASGSLDQAEFTAMVEPIRAAQASAVESGSTEANAWAEALFARADANGDASLTKAEVKTIFMG